MQALDALAKELNLSPDQVQKEGLKTLLETQIYSLSSQLETICRKYDVESYRELDGLIQNGKVEETKVLDDFQLADHLEARIRRLKKILFDQIDASSS